MISRVKFVCAVVVCVFVSCVSARAADFGPFDLGVFGPGSTNSFSQQIGKGTFVTDYTLQLADGSAIEAVVERIVLTNFFFIPDAGFTLKLFNIDGPETQIGPTAAASGGSISLMAAGLSAGNYLLRVTATGTGQAGGLFAGAVAVVPLPPSVLMLLSALVTLLLFRRLTPQRAA